MNTNDNPDSTAPLPGSQVGDFEAFVRNTLSLIITRLDRIESQNANLKNDVDQLNKSVDQLNRDQHDRYVDLRMRLSTLDEKIDAHLRGSRDPQTRSAQASGESRPYLVGVTAGNANSSVNPQSDHSCLSATIGSIFVARRAGR